MDQQISLQGSVTHIVYQNADNGYTVFELSEKVAENSDAIVCTGLLYGLNEGEDVKLTGTFVNHPSYGRQFSVQFYEKHVPTTSAGIERYLASGAIKGIGAKLAARIVEKFGDNTISIIEGCPSKLAEINGITLKKAVSISETFNMQREMRDMLIALQHYGVSIAYGTKIYKKYGAGTLNIIKTNPYLLCDEVRGIGFVTADTIAKKIGIAQDSPYRIRSAIKHTLGEAAQNNGHCWLPEDRLRSLAAEFLSVPCDYLDNTLADMQIDKEIHREKAGDTIRVYLRFYYHAEVFIARKLNSLTNVKQPQTDSFQREISAIERENGIKFAPNQRAAISEAVTNGVFIMTGGPGTGKTTTLKAIIRVLVNRGFDVELAAPTGRAAKRLSEATGCEAQTIHRLLGMTYAAEDSGHMFEKNEDSPLEANAVIIDEASMMDISLTYHLLKALPENAKLIFTGDVNQLPSVGPGNVLNDLLKSGRIRYTTLDIIFRQAQESAIVTYAHMINNGIRPSLTIKTKDFFFIKQDTAAQCAEEIVSLASKRLPAYLRSDDMFDIQVLTPTRKSDTGVYNLNMLLREAINPKSKKKREKQFKNIVFREGDKVMHIKNNYTLPYTVFDSQGNEQHSGTGVFNGDFGVIKSICPESGGVTVVYDENKYVVYDDTQLDELEHSFAVTIHKSQGSEYRAVIIPLLSGPPMLMSRNLLYTALTRAKELAVIVGVPNTIFKMIDNNREIQRYTALKERIAGKGL